MRKIHRRTSQLISVAIASTVICGGALAGDDTIQIQNGFQLPGVTLPSGHDEVRAADGTSCRSAVSGTGAYLDIGVIGNPSDINASQSAYGRVVVPLGRRPNRVDCTQLYALEVERLRMELKLMQMGMDRPLDVPSSSEVSQAEFEDDAWSQDGR